ncbi:MAG: secreted hydrolase [Pseudarthrobacter sp.]|nr:secreted hydrolase [Pseudarthrobacter sp.]
MATSTVRRRRTALAAGLATMAMAVGFAAIPAEAAPRADATYVAVGDSYTAGTGAGDFSGTPACLQTEGGYVDVVGAMGRVDQVGNEACHGALLSPMHPLYVEGSSPNTVAQQMALLVAAGKLSGDTDMVSITAGANDIGFSGILFTCAAQPQNCQAALPSEANLLTLRQALAATYGQLHMRAPDAKVAALGYPHLFDATRPVEGLNIDPAILAAMNVATDQLNETIRLAADDAAKALKADIVFIDVTKRFLGHEANSIEPWLYYDKTSPFDPRSFHPTATGHAEGYAPALVSAAKPAQLAAR